MIRDKLEIAFLDGATDTEALFQYLRFFVKDDQDLEKLESGFQSEKLIVKDLKAALTKVFQEQISKFQEDRVQITDPCLKDVMTRRLLE